ncbi:response regulator transcription factor [Echinicola sp. CAU 1574]|uniref:Response regulator transcription factor n=1 Tax=Echinicola arenosa TaxID=2774144 RepID=A0ABR9AMU0_9BACT|nr:response regulator transcription factor [Echinicola arenosa]MBD8488929.1 response regulator transcription factor [Echinicola arenosa]
MKINCIIVEDEPASRDLLEKYIADCPSLNLVATCKHALEAMEVIHEQSIHLIFLDINMPKLSGLSFYKSLSNAPYVIFTTAYPQYAIEGFELDAVDYLLKPFPFERFLKAVQKAIHKVNAEKPLSQESAYIILKSDKKLFRVGMDEIFYLEALGDYVKVITVDKSIIVHDTFQGILQQLPSNEFIRVHKSFAVALHKLDHIEGNMIHIKENTVPIGQTYKAEFLNLIKP